MSSFIARKCEEYLAASREEVIEAREEGVSYNLDNSPVEVIIDENSQIEGNDRLFAGGDIVNGPDVITAIEDGHRAAKGIDEFLMK